VTVAIVPPIAVFAPSSGNVVGRDGLILAATAELPESEYAETIRVGRYRVVVEVALHDRSEPLSGCRRRVMHTSLELLLDFFKLGPHPFADRLALHHKVPVPVLPADMRESQKIERCGFTFSSLYPVQLGKSPELNPARFIWVQLQPEPSQPFPEIIQEAVCVDPILEAEYVVVGISHHHNVASRAFLAPDLYPEVEYVMEIDIGEQHGRRQRDAGET
jgi:hypothetical protein